MLLFPPESIREVSVQTSVYDASVAGGGGSVQVVTKSGSNFLHGGVYEYFRNEALNANDANLKAVGESRPVMRRNAYGATLGGPLRKNQGLSPEDSLVSTRSQRSAARNERLRSRIDFGPRRSAGQRGGEVVPNCAQDGCKLLSW